MKAWKPVLLFVLVCTCAAASGDRPQLEVSGSLGAPANDTASKSLISPGNQDGWDSAKEETPPLAPGKAVRLAKQYVVKVPLRSDMKEWRLDNIVLHQLAEAPKEAWIYVAHFSALPNANVWNGPLPHLSVPVRMDGTIPESAIRNL